jgi:hypothetical protein
MAPVPRTTSDPAGSAAQSNGSSGLIAALRSGA